MLISIIIPCYNCEETVTRAIVSVLNQCYRNIELILVNDGSVDNTKNICESFSENDVRVKCFTTPNQGPSYARNYGISKAKGEYVLFIDADDYIEENTIGDLVNLARNNDFEIIFYGYSHDKYEKGYLANSINISYSQKKINNNQEFRDIFNSLSDSGYLYQVWNKMYKRKFIHDCDASFPLGVRVAEDFSFNLTLYMRLNKAYISTNCYYHYISNSSGSLTTSFDPTRSLQVFKAYKKNRELIKSWNNNYLNTFDNHFLLDISVCINNLFNEDCSYSFREKIDYIKDILDKTHALVVQIPAVGLRNKIVKTFIQFRMTLLLWIMGKLSRIKCRFKG